MTQFQNHLYPETHQGQKQPNPLSCRPVKVVYKKHHPTSSIKSPEFFVLANEGAVDLYKCGKLSLMDTVQTFDIFVASTGNQGLTQRPDSNTLLETFGSGDRMFVLDFILRHGVPHGHSVHVKHVQGNSKFDTIQTHHGAH